MKGIRFEFLRTKVARRLFGLFVTLAVIPVTILAVSSWMYLLSELREQAMDTMEDQNAIAAQMIIDRLRRAEQDLRNVRRVRSESASLGAAWASVNANSLVGLGAFVENSISPWLWIEILVPVLIQPLWLVLGLPGAVLVLITRRKRRKSIFFKK